MKANIREAADPASAVSDCDAISGVVDLAATAPLSSILLLLTTALAGNQLLCPEECRSSARARRASRVAGYRLVLLMRCGELSVGGVCRCRGLGCNYSQWLSADYISANVPPSASILMELGSVAECIGTLQGLCSERVKGGPLPTTGSILSIEDWLHCDTTWCININSLSLMNISLNRILKSKLFKVFVDWTNQNPKITGWVEGGGATARL